MALTIDQLNQAKCNCNKSNCNNDVIYVHAVCHPEAGCEVAYHKKSEIFVFRCQECKRLIVEIDVGK